MDDRVGPMRGWNGNSCGYNSSPNFESEYECNKSPVTRHFMLNTLDGQGFYPGVLACQQHENSISPELIKMYHPFGLFCTKEGSLWDFELNECVMPLDTLERAFFGEEDFAKELLDEFKQFDQR